MKVLIPWLGKHTITTSLEKFMGAGQHLSNMSQRIGVSEIEVVDLERSSNHPFLDEWSGLIELEGNTERFSTDQSLQKGVKYQVVWERTEPLVGEQIVRIHDVINDGS